ncbi:MAG TPA: hypothetical protein DCE24_07005, partial [Porphyromonadaceae bacterium]|nr:hypothetical protein [Porphyromonadaceae bacterium]
MVNLTYLSHFHDLSPHHYFLPNENTTTSLQKKFAYIKNVPYLCIAFKEKHFLRAKKGDSLAQLVEHNTFNVGV